MYAQSEILETDYKQQTSYGCRISISDSSFCANNYAEADIMYSEISDVYVAGLFDGEGYIGIKNFKGKTYLRYRLAISNQHKGVLGLIKKRFGGNIYKKDNKIECQQWEINNKQEAINFLEKIIPHLIVKKEKADKSLKLIYDKKGYDKSRQFPKTKRKW